MDKSSPQRQLAAQAERWFVLLESGTATTAQRERFQAWLDESHAHRTAYSEVAGLCYSLLGQEQLARLEPVAPAPRVQASIALETFGDRLRAGVGHLRWLGGAVAAGLLLWIGTVLLEYDAGAEVMSLQTRVAEIRDVTLEDGSSISLGARTRLSVQYQSHQRRVVLVGGEAFFAITNDPGRPFVVQVDDTEIRVVGTEFNVRTSARQLDVAVAEGVVEISKPKPAPIALLGRLMPETRMLAAGQQLVAIREKNGKLSAIEPIDSDRLGSWRRGQLIYHNVLLREVVADVKRYTDQEIVLLDNSLGDLTVTAAFGTDQVDNMLNGLAALLPIEVERAVPGTVILKPRR